MGRFRGGRDAESVPGAAPRPGDPALPPRLHILPPPGFPSTRGHLPCRPLPLSLISRGDPLSKRGDICRRRRLGLQHLRVGGGASSPRNSALEKRERTWGPSITPSLAWWLSGLPRRCSLTHAQGRLCDPETRTPWLGSKELVSAEPSRRAAHGCGCLAWALGLGSDERCTGSETSSLYRARNPAPFNSLPQQQS